MTISCLWVSYFVVLTTVHVTLLNAYFNDNHSKLTVIKPKKKMASMIAQPCAVINYNKQSICSR